RIIYYSIIIFIITDVYFIFFFFFFSSRRRHTRCLSDWSSDVCSSDLTQIDYADYRDVNGIKFPFRITFAWLDGRDSIVLNEIRTNVAIDEAKFGKPSPLKPR